MSKQTSNVLIIGLVILAVFFYFIFGSKSKPNNSINEVATEKTETKIPDNLEIKDTLEGAGPEVKSGDTILIHYEGRLTDKTKFDSSYDRGEPFQTIIGVGQVIPGWDIGVVGMKVGGKRTLSIPPELGYGTQQNGDIPANSTLIFDVELIEIK